MNMIAVGSGEAWALIGFVGLILWATWVMLSLTFHLIDRAHSNWRESRRLTEAVQLSRERGD